MTSTGQIVRRVFGLPNGQPKVSIGVICTVNSESHEISSFADETGDLGKFLVAKPPARRKMGLLEGGEPLRGGVGRPSQAG